MKTQFSWIFESVIKWVYYDFEYKSVYFYPNLICFEKSPENMTFFYFYKCTLLLMLEDTVSSLGSETYCLWVILLHWCHLLYPVPACHGLKININLAFITDIIHGFSHMHKSCVPSGINFQRHLGGGGSIQFSKPPSTPHLHISTQQYYTLINFWHTPPSTFCTI